jgi:hypothetical protein
MIDVASDSGHADDSGNLNTGFQEVSAIPASPIPVRPLHFQGSRNALTFATICDVNSSMLNAMIFLPMRAGP